MILVEISERRLKQMQELTFEVMHIQTEKRINGNTQIRLKCIQDDILVNIEIPNSERDNRELIKRKAIDEYNRYLESKNKNHVDVGSVI